MNKQDDVGRFAVAANTLLPEIRRLQDLPPDSHPQTLGLGDWNAAQALASTEFVLKRIAADQED